MKKFLKVLGIIFAIIFYLALGIIAVFFCADGSLFEPFFDDIWNLFKSLIKREITLKECIQKIKNGFKELKIGFKELIDDEK